MGKLNDLVSEMSKWNMEINNNDIYYSKSGRFLHIGIQNSGDGTWKYDLKTGNNDYVGLDVQIKDEKNHPDYHKITRKEMESLLN